MPVNLTANPQSFERGGKPLRGLPPLKSNYRNGNSGDDMLAIRKIQWIISLSVLIYGVALFGGLGVTAIIFVGVGLVYCALAFWASRLTILPLSTTVVADSLLAWVSWRLLVGTLESVPVNARFQGRKVDIVDYLNLDGVASVVVLALVGLYFVVITLKLKELRKQNWL